MIYLTIVTAEDKISLFYNIILLHNSIDLAYMCKQFSENQWNIIM